MQKELILNTCRLFFSKLLPALLMTLINVIYSRLLSQEDYGSYQVIWTYLNVFVIFSAFGLPKYILSAGGNLKQEDFKKLFRIFLLIFLSIFFLIGFYILVFSNHFDLRSGSLFLLLLVSQTFFLIQESYIISNDESKKLLLPSIVYSFLLLMGHLVIFYWIGYSLSNCVLVILIVSLLRNMILWGQGFKNIFNKHHNLQKEADFSLMYWIGLNDSFQIFTKWLDKLVLLFLLPAAEFAVYYNGTFELPLVGMFLLTFQSVLTFYGAKESENVNYRIDLFRSSALMMSGFIFPLFAWMFWYSGPIVNLLFGSKYEDSSVLFAFTTLFLPVRICSYTVLLQLANKGRIILTGSIIDFIISLSLMILLYPFFKLNGLVLALVISTYLQAGFYLLNISKTYNVSIGKLLDFPALFLKIVFSVVFIGGVYYLGSLFLAPFYSLVAGGIVLCFFFLYHLMKLYPKISTGHLPARRQGK